MKRYPLSSVDVVNEAIRPDGTGHRPSLWLDAFGPGYIDTALPCRARRQSADKAGL